MCVCEGKWGGPHVSPHIFLLPPAFAISHFPLLTQHTYTHNEHKKTDNKPTTHTSYTHTHNSHNIYNKHETHTHNTDNTVHTALSPNSPLFTPLEMLRMLRMLRMLDAGIFGRPHQI